jgi:membrane associated rhomboid family serine protease
MEAPTLPKMVSLTLRRGRRATRINAKGQSSVGKYTAVQTLIIANIVGYLLELVVGENLTVGLGALWPLGVNFMPWQVVTYAFLHANPMHLLFNMFGLWMFGRELEYLLGRRGFVQLYFASVLSAAVTQLLVSGISGDTFPTLGASGGVFGLLLAYGMFFPNRMIMLLIPPIPMPARVFVVVYAALELFLGVTGTQAGVAHFAHLGGMVGAYLVLRRRRGRRR